MFDLLSDIFETIRLRGTLYFRTDYSPPWAITVPAYAQAARFHFVIQGRCGRCARWYRLCDRTVCARLYRSRCLVLLVNGGALLVVLGLQKPEAVQTRTVNV
jgi:hypothetical protein